MKQQSKIRVKIEVVYTIEDVVKTTGKYIAGADLGLNNLMAIYYER